jgi:thioredoxin-like negative regulator of GroEL
MIKEVEWKPSTAEVLPDTFGKVIAAHDVVVFHFWASWNAYDVTMDQMLGEIANDYSDQIFIGSIDTDNQENWARCKELRILNLPAIATFVKGKHFETVMGLGSREFLGWQSAEMVERCADITLLQHELNLLVQIVSL